MSHWLIIHEQGEDYDIEHGPDCPTENWIDDPNGIPIKMHTCLVGALISDAGLDILDEDWHELPIGRYEIEGWTQKYGAIPGFSADEWDAGIRLITNAG